ncbi:hypothetical protein JAAARDRAFT_492418 [Jaapia argillacea MUCL 33604]|uniref:Uncharacterized protein n=1 Tax=Jaapia argillacea MUCL 33604 TaxID=933084 RepID=A0A067PNQ0_9AGAM|nr:hypothetical protein JAAARDRAFT_492418 [Jaapia argillacea MUCL 33604]
MEVKGRDSESKEGGKNSLQEHSGLLKEDGDSLQKILVVTVGDVTRRFRYHPRGEIASNVFEFEVSSVANQGRIPDGGYVGVNEGLPRWAVLAAAGGIPITILASFILPYIVIFILSGFKAGRSTVAQRAWMMSWASSGQLSLLFFGLVVLGLPHFGLSTFKRAPGDSLAQTCILHVVFCSVLLLLTIPAIGGLITVGQMLKEFGTCSLAPA